MADLSVIIPARNEMFLARTVEDILANMRGDTEIIVVLDGEKADPPVMDHPKVTIIEHSISIGQRAASNEAVKISKAKYILKCDAHCSFSEGFDVKLMEDMHDDWTMVPVMKNLHVFDWVCKKCGDRRYQGTTPIECPKCDNKSDFERDIVWISKDNPLSTSYCFDSEPHFQYFREFKSRPEGKGDLTETMSLQGSCFMLTRDKYWELNICDEEFGSWGSQGIEVAVKTHLSGGKVCVNHKTWYAHMFRTKGGDFGFPYPISGRQTAHAKSSVRDLFFNNKWDKQIYPLSWMLDKFWPVPGWTEEQLISLKKNELNTERSGIYSIKSLTNGRIYIGSTINIKDRICGHVKDLKQNKHCNVYLQNTWNKYGENDFVFNILYFCLEDDLIKNEQRFIDDYKEKFGRDILFNICLTAGSSLGTVCTEETKEKISKTKIENPSEAWNKGLTKETDERVRKYGESGRVTRKINYENGEYVHPRGMLGKHHTEETKEEIGFAQREVPKTEEHNRKNSEAHLGKIFSEEHRRNLSIAEKQNPQPHGNKGQFVSRNGETKSINEKRELSKGMLYYTDNQCDEKIANMVKEQLLKISKEKNIKIISVSLQPIDFGKNIVLQLERGILTMFKQILIGLEAIDTDIVFFAEHDVLYSEEHFEFTPPNKETYFYNQNTWQIRLNDGYAVSWDCKKQSQLCGYREFLIHHYIERIRRIESEGFSRNMGFEPGTHNRPERVDDFKAEGWRSKIPNLDIRHGKNLTKSRWSQSEFRSQRNCRNWKESHINCIEGWEGLKL